MKLKFLRSLLHLRRGEFAHALAVAGQEKAVSSSWAALAYYRLGMYETVIRLPLEWTANLNVVSVTVSLAACGEHEKARAVLQKMRWRWTPARLRVFLSDALAPFMPVEALQLLESVARNAPASLHAALLLRNQRCEQAAQVLAHALAQGQAKHSPELYLYQSMATQGTPEVQLKRLNHFFAAHGLPAVVLRDEQAPPSPCNVQVTGERRAVDGPLVSVLMTTFRTGERAAVAIESLLNQTYRNLEIIVVDDASGDETPDLVDEWVRKDARVKLLRLKSNGGTYLAKSMGLKLARGEFVTCHDSDDWSHPLKIEFQVRPLLEDKALVATTSHWVRMQDDGMFFARPVHSLMRLNPSSPLFRRVPVLQKMGGWDCVRTGADSEFHARLNLVFGKKAIKRIKKPLALGSHRAGSLMTADETGYSDAGVSPQRLAYWQAWSCWHLDCLREGKLPFISLELMDVARHRMFSAPKEICVTILQIEAAQEQLQQFGQSSVKVGHAN